MYTLHIDPVPPAIRMNVIQTLRWGHGGRAPRATLREAADIARTGGLAACSRDEEEILRMAVALEAHGARVRIE